MGLLSFLSAPVTDERAQLRAALAAQEPAAAKLREAEQALERAQATIDAVAPAEAAVKAADAAAAGAAKRWAESGSQGELPAADQRLVDQAQQARRDLERAELMAEGARRALPKLFVDMRSAQAEVDSAKNATYHAAGDIASTTVVEPLLTELAELHERYLAIYRQLAAIRLATGPGFGPSHAFFRTGHGAIYLRICKALTDFAIAEPPPMQRAITNPVWRAEAQRWVDLVDRLLADPAATVTLDV